MPKVVVQKSIDLVALSKDREQRIAQGESSSQETAAHTTEEVTEA